MKNFFASFSGVIMAILMLFSFAGCDDNESNVLEDNKGVIKASAQNIVTTKCMAQQNNNYFNNVECFYDDEYNYWVFDMGILVDVPLEETYSYYNYTGGNIKHTFSTTKVTATSIKSTTGKSATKSSTWKNTHAINVGLSVNFGIDDLLEANISAGYNYETSKSETETDSWSRSFENCESYSESEANSVEITFDNSCEKGYYRYVYVGIVNVYTAITQNRTTNEYSVDTYTKVKAYGYSLDYDKDSPVFDNFDDKTLEFDLSLINNLPTPTRKILSGDLDFVEPELESLTVFNKTIRTGSTKINGSGHYTLDTFTLEKNIKNLLDLGYTKLNIKISYDLKEEDNCIQYISLFTSTNYNIRNETIEHGGNKRDKTWGTHYMDFYILINELDSNIFNFKCKAENAIFKDFYIGTVKVNIIAEA